MLYLPLVALFIVVGIEAAGGVCVGIRRLPQQRSLLNSYVCIHAISHSHVSYDLMKRKQKKNKKKTTQFVLISFTVDAAINRRRYEQAQMS